MSVNFRFWSPSHSDPFHLSEVEIVLGKMCKRYLEGSKCDEAFRDQQAENPSPRCWNTRKTSWLWMGIYRYLIKQMDLEGLTGDKHKLVALDLTDYQFYTFLGDGYKSYSRDQSRHPFTKDVEIFIEEAERLEAL